MNYRAIEEGRRLRAQIAAIVDSFRPGQRYTWKDIARRLENPPSKPRILAHLNVVLNERSLLQGKARPGLVFDSKPSAQTEPMTEPAPKTDRPINHVYAAIARKVALSPAGPFDKLKDYREKPRREEKRWEPDQV